MECVHVDARQANRLFRFLEPSGSDSGLDVVELESCVGAESISTESPLRISTLTCLSEGEQVVPFADDCGSYVSLGNSQTVDGATTILLERIPNGLLDVGLGWVVIRFYRRSGRVGNGRAQ